MGTAPKKDDAEAKSRTKLDKFWRKIDDAAGCQYSLTLRAVANIIGYCISPIGWSWDEYSPYESENQQSYEKEGRRIRFLGLTAPKDCSEAGTRASAAGAVFRRHEVERLLLRLIHRNEIQITIHDEQLRGCPLSDKLRLDEAMYFCVADSSIGLPDLRWGCSVDAPDLVEVMKLYRFRGERTKNFDWLLIERYLRNIFETDGCDETDVEFLKSLHDWYAEKFPQSKEPTVSTTLNLIFVLRREYQFSE